MSTTKRFFTSALLADVSNGRSDPIALKYRLLDGGYIVEFFLSLAIVFPIFGSCGSTIAIFTSGG
jgi:hypothetical protein